MPNTPTTRGIALMVLAMLVIPFVDGIAKYLSATYSPLFISWARYAVACVIVLPMAFLQFGWKMFPRENLIAHLIRTFCLVAAMTLYFMAIARIPLALAVSAYFVGPIVAVLLAVFFLDEQLNARKVLSLILGIVGSVIILQPTGEIEPGILLAFGAGVLFAVYLIATRFASQQEEPIKALALQCFIGALLLSPQGYVSFAPLQMNLLWLFCALGFLSAVGHLLTIKAFGLADASTLSPLVYVELIGVAFIGFFFFKEIPSVLTVVGAFLIVLAGLILVINQEN